MMPQGMMGGYGGMTTAGGVYPPNMPVGGMYQPTMASYGGMMVSVCNSVCVCACVCVCVRACVCACVYTNLHILLCTYSKCSLVCQQVWWAPIGTRPTWWCHRYHNNSNSHSSSSTTTHKIHSDPFMLRNNRYSKLMHLKLTTTVTLFFLYSINS